MSGARTANGMCVAYNFPTGEVLILDVDADGYWHGGTEARYDTYQEASLKWRIQRRGKMRMLPAEFRNYSSTPVISYLCQ